MHCERGFLQQCQNCKKRLRHEFSAVLNKSFTVATDGAFKTAEYRGQFRKKIGFLDKENKYSPMRVPILHAVDDYD